MADDLDNSEQQLWRAVLSQLFFDATNSRVGTPSARRDRDSARSYLTTRSRDLAEVCTLADIDMSRAITAFKIKIDEAMKHDQDPAIEPIKKDGRSRRRGEGQNFKQSPPDRSFSVAQESTQMDFSS